MAREPDFQVNARAGKYNGMDLKRTARMYDLEWAGMPANSRAMLNAREPYFQSVPGLRLLTLLRRDKVGPHAAPHLCPQ